MFSSKMFSSSILLRSRLFGCGLQPFNSLNRPFSSFKEKLASANKPLWISFVGISCLAIGFTTYMNREKRVKIVQTGKVDIGGDFNLVDQDGNKRNLSSFAGKWFIMYFGFCRCPDICPEQLERLVEVVNRVAILDKKSEVIPVFISVDPERDTPPVIKEYIKEFSSKLVGLTGTPEEIKSLSKKYRIYYSPGPKDADGDYIVDHTVVMYLMNPNGEFEQYYGQLKPVTDVVRDIVRRVQDFRKSG